jgi:hypothetical protein
MASMKILFSLFANVKTRYHIACTSLCLTCTAGDDDSCESCWTKDNRHLVNNTCLCDDGFFDDGV